MRVSRSLGVAILLLCLAACGSRLSQENFDKIHQGMSQKEVREILGEPWMPRAGASSGSQVARLSGRTARPPSPCTFERPGNQQANIAD